MVSRLSPRYWEKSQPATVTAPAEPARNADARTAVSDVVAMDRSFMIPDLLPSRIFRTTQFASRPPRFSAVQPVVHRLAGPPGNAPRKKPAADRFGPAGETQPPTPTKPAAGRGLIGDDFSDATILPAALPV